MASCCLVSYNIAVLLNELQVLPKEDIETLNLCTSMMDRGECPPLMVVFDPHEGYEHTASECSFFL